MAEEQNWVARMVSQVWPTRAAVDSVAMTRRFLSHGRGIYVVAVIFFCLSASLFRAVFVRIMDQREAVIEDIHKLAQTRQESRSGDPRPGFTALLLARLNESIEEAAWPADVTSTVATTELLGLTPVIARAAYTASTLDGLASAIGPSFLTAVDRPISVTLNKDLEEAFTKLAMSVTKENGVLRYPPLFEVSRCRNQEAPGSSGVPCAIQVKDEIAQPGRPSQFVTSLASVDARSRGTGETVAVADSVKEGVAISRSLDLAWDMLTVRHAGHDLCALTARASIQIKAAYIVSPDSVRYQSCDPFFVIAPNLPSTKRFDANRYVAEIRSKNSSRGVLTSAAYVDLGANGLVSTKCARVVSNNDEYLSSVCVDVGIPLEKLKTELNKSSIVSVIHVKTQTGLDGISLVSAEAWKTRAHAELRLTSAVQSELHVALRRAAEKLTPNGSGVSLQQTISILERWHENLDSFYVPVASSGSSGLVDGLIVTPEALGEPMLPTLILAMLTLIAAVVSLGWGTYRLRREAETEMIYEVIGRIRSAVFIAASRIHAKRHPLSAVDTEDFVIEAANEEAENLLGTMLPRIGPHLNTDSLGVESVFAAHEMPSVRFEDMIDPRIVPHSELSSQSEDYWQYYRDVVRSTRRAGVAGRYYARLVRGANSGKWIMVSGSPFHRAFASLGRAAQVLVIVSSVDENKSAQLDGVLASAQAG